MNDQIRLLVKDFRAIQEADIKLNGITVVSGINGCGKSSLSKFLYYTFKYANEYDSLVVRSLEDSLEDIFRLFKYLERELRESSVKIEDIPIIKINNNEDILEQLSKTKNDIIRHLNYLFDEYKNLAYKTTISEKRILNIVKDILEQYEEKNLNYLFPSLTKKIEELFDDASKLIKKRSLKVLLDNVKEEFRDSSFPKQYDVSEYEDSIMKNNAESVPIVHFVQQTVYIDTPMMFGFSNDNHWEDLNEILKKKKISSYNKEINTLITDDILNGESEFDNESTLFSSEEFQFKRKDGSVFDLLDCATGVKAFSILQLLLKNGTITKNTLLIIDEPEAHLHPQWIVEYARLIVLLNKEVGVRFFIASHSPDMVSAIKYISQKEKIDSKVAFYLAQPTEEDRFRFTYQYLERDIEPIFESFNVAFDRINQYGSAD